MYTQGIKYSRLHPQAQQVRDAFVSTRRPADWWGSWRSVRMNPVQRDRGVGNLAPPESVSPKPLLEASNIITCPLDFPLLSERHWKRNCESLA